MECQDPHFILSLRGAIQESTTYQEGRKSFLPRKEIRVPFTHLSHQECILSLNYYRKLK